MGGIESAVLAALALKLGVTALFVVSASLAAERVGPLVGAMVATLPVSAGPAYVFLALEHDAAFISDSALSSIVTNAITAVYSLVYATLAQRHGPALSIGGALAVWIAGWFASRGIEWTLIRAALLTAIVFPVCLVLASRYRNAPMRSPRRRWFDLPLRAGLVGALVTAVVALSHSVGPALTGMLAVFPVVLTSLMLILHPRVGGRGAGAVIANAISGLLGFAAALAALHVAAPVLGVWLALALTLAISVGWNVTVFTARRYGIPL
ncbi:MAG: hypothetical protein J0H62_07750 [Rhizobiales bacterium]|nr:hypothetical protein [Hyphomicrobiales bacterium]